MSIDNNKDGSISRMDIGCMEHCNGVPPQVKAMHLLTVRQEWAPDALHVVPGGTVYGANVEALEDQFVDQYLIAAYCT
jgi:hypothetical protein